MIGFFDVDAQYCNFLRAVDKRIPYISYSAYDKFLCGVVLQINGFDYYAPVSSNTIVFRTSMPIWDRKNSEIIATIRFSYMFPAPQRVLSKKNFDVIKQNDPQYANLLMDEWIYCRKNEAKIYEMAKKVYGYGCVRNHYLSENCCEFLALEAITNTFPV